MRKSGEASVILRHRLALSGEFSEEIVSYGEPKEISMVIQPARGRLLFEQYGERLSYMKNCFCETSLEIVPGDGIWLFANESERPDYVAVSVSDWPGHKAVLLEKAV